MILDNGKLFTKLECGISKEKIKETVQHVESQL